MYSCEAAPPPPSTLTHRLTPCQHRVQLVFLSPSCRRPDLGKLGLNNCKLFRELGLSPLRFLFTLHEDRPSRLELGLDTHHLLLALLETKPEKEDPSEGRKMEGYNAGGKSETFFVL